MKTVKINIQNETRCVIHGLLPEHHEYLFKKYGIYQAGYRWTPQFKMGIWDGKIRFYESTGKTYTRLLDEIVPIIDGWGYEFDVEDNRVEAKPISTRVSPKYMGEHLEFKPGVPFSLRDYQVDAINTMVEAGSGFLIAGTGAGKTSICAGLSKVFNDNGYKIIIIVPSDDLIKQTVKLFKKLELNVGVYSGSSKDIDSADCVVATWQAIQYNLEMVRQFQALIWDEAHGADAAVAQKILNDYGGHISYRFGVTGTFPKDEVDGTKLRCSIGPILKEIPTWWLIEKGYLAQLTIQEVEINETFVTENFPSYDSEKAFVSKNTTRMEMIANIIVSAAEKHGNTLVLVNSIQFGKKLSALIKDSVFLYGQNSTDEREEQYAEFDTHDDLIVIASSGIASTGISIDRVFCLMFVDAGKAFERSIQSVGRGLRLADDKNEVAVYDIHSKLKWGKKHWKERQKYYTEARYPMPKKLVVNV